MVLTISINIISIKTQGISTTYVLICLGIRLCLNLFMIVTYVLITVQQTHMYLLCNRHLAQLLSDKSLNW